MTSDFLPLSLCEPPRPSVLSLYAAFFFTLPLRLLTFPCPYPLDFCFFFWFSALVLSFVIMPVPILCLLLKIPSLLFLVLRSFKLYDLQLTSLRFIPSTFCILFFFTHSLLLRFQYNFLPSSFCFLLSSPLTSPFTLPFTFLFTL